MLMVDASRGFDMGTPSEFRRWSGSDAGRTGAGFRLSLDAQANAGSVVLELMAAGQTPGTGTAHQAASPFLKLATLARAAPSQLAHADGGIHLISLPSAGAWMSHSSWSRFVRLKRLEVPGSRAAGYPADTVSALAVARTFPGQGLTGRSLLRWMRMWPYP